MQPRFFPGHTGRMILVLSNPIPVWYYFYWTHVHFTSSTQSWQHGSHSSAAESAESSCLESVYNRRLIKWNGFSPRDKGLDIPGHVVMKTLGCKRIERPGVFSLRWDQCWDLLSERPGVFSLRGDQRWDLLSERPGVFSLRWGGGGDQRWDLLSERPGVFSENDGNNIT